MKRFLIVLFICLMPFGADAEDLSYILRKWGLLSQEIDDDAVYYIDENDYQDMLKYKINVKTYDLGNSKTGGGYANGRLYLSTSRDIAFTQGAAHHELQHVKDGEVTGIDRLGILEPVSEALMGAVKEARAYSEEAVFLYD